LQSESIFREEMLKAVALFTKGDAVAERSWAPD